MDGNEVSAVRCALRATFFSPVSPSFPSNIKRIKRSFKLLFTLVVTAASLPAFADKCGSGLQPACAAVPMTPVNSAGQIWGFSGSALGDLDVNQGLSRTAMLNKYVDSGAKIVRTDINWGFIQPIKGAPMNAAYLALMDQRHDDLAARGIRQVLVIMGSPYWALDDSNKGWSSPTNVSVCTDPSAGAALHNCFAPVNVDNAEIRKAWQDYIQFLVKRYPDLAGIEIWNEPNLQKFWGKYTFDASNPYKDADRLANMLAAAADASHQVAPNLPVLATPLAIYNYPTSNSPDLTFSTWLNRLYTTAGASKFDAISLHLYPCNTPTDYMAQMNSWMSQYRNIRNANGDSVKPFWITETGASSSMTATNCGNSFTEQEQNLIIAKTMDWAKAQNVRNGDLPVALVYTLFNTENRIFLQVNTDSAQSGYGLVAWSKNMANGTVSFTDKPAYATVRCKMKGGC